MQQSSLMARRIQRAWRRTTLWALVQRHVREGPSLAKVLASPDYQAGRRVVTSAGATSALVRRLLFLCALRHRGAPPMTLKVNIRHLMVPFLCEKYAD